MSRISLAARLMSLVALAALSAVAVAGQLRAPAERGTLPDREAVVGLPGDVDDESCDEPSSDDESDELSDCFIGKAVVDPDEPSTLTLEGRFCDEPAVFVGSAGGVLEPLFVEGSGASFIQADLSPWNDPGTRIVIVRCPCETCAMDVTVGAAGPTGPEGPTGPQGPSGEIPDGLAASLLLEVHTGSMLVGEELSCVAAHCANGQVVTGGGYSVCCGEDGILEPATGFEVASSGPYLFSAGAGPKLPSQRWIVCGTGDSSLNLMVYAVCLGGPPGTCGDGWISPPEACETDQDCERYSAAGARCVDCACEWCGDGVITPPETCEPGVGLCEQCHGCECEDTWDPGGGD